MNISSEKTALEKAINSVGLPDPLPDRWQKPLENLIRNCLKNAKKIVEFPGMTQRDFINFSGAIREHVGPKYLDCWDAMEDAYSAAPEGKMRSQFAFCLMQAAGSSKQYVAKILDAAMREKTSDIWDFTAWLLTKIDQEQWHRFPPHLADEKLLEQNINLIRKKKTQIEKRGVKPWIPGVEL